MIKCPKCTKWVGNRKHVESCDGTRVDRRNPANRCAADPARKAAPAVAAAAGACKITVGEFTHEFAFASIADLELGLEVFVAQCQRAREILPLARLAEASAALAPAIATAAAPRRRGRP